MMFMQKENSLGAMQDLFQGNDIKVKWWNIFILVWQFKAFWKLLIRAKLSYFLNILLVAFHVSPIKSWQDRIQKQFNFNKVGHQILQRLENIIGNQIYFYYFYCMCWVWWAIFSKIERWKRERCLSLSLRLSAVWPLETFFSWSQLLRWGAFQL